MYNLNPKVVYGLHSTHPKMWLINVVLVYLNDKLCLLVTSPHRAAGKRVKMWKIASTNGNSKLHAYSLAVFLD